MHLTVVSTASARRPSRPAGPPSSQRDESENVDTGPLVLVVDDTEDSRLLYAEVLAEAGYRVAQATNGEEALSLLAQSKPAVILMDLSMPLMDGWEATKRIKADPATADIIVIVLTGHGTQLGQRLATEAGAQTVLTKPCLPDDVVACVRTLLSDES